MAKASKGSVQIGSSNGRLRLVWSYQGKRQYFYLGVPDSKVNRIAAKSKAAIIEGDLATGNFDPTLNKYKSDTNRTDLLTVAELLGVFIKHKESAIDGNTLLKYKIVAKHLKEFFGEKLARDIEDPLAIKFKDWLLTKQKPITVQDRLSILKSCWKWALLKKMIPYNPWIEAARRVKVPPKQNSKPFTKEECKAILESFRSHKYYHLYADYVEFSMLTGMRTGEVICFSGRLYNHQFGLSGTIDSQCGHLTVCAQR